MSEQIKAKHYAFIKTCASHMNYSNQELASQFNVGERTIEKWKRDYQEEIKEVIDNNVRESVEKCRKHSNEAIDALLSLLHSENHNARLGAIKLLTEITGIKENNINIKHETGLQIILEGQNDNSETTAETNTD